MLELSAQCCDAGNYLDLGRLCADVGQCWHAFRPGGTIYWFSIPYRLGLDPGILVGMNIALMLLSTILAPIALRNLRPSTPSPLKGRILVLLFALSLLLHVILFYPILFNSLIDGPAAACGLTGLWLLLMSKHRHSLLLTALAGIFLGVCVWMRAFYLYPLAIALTGYLLCWLLSRERKWRDLLLLFALLPIFIQFYATHKEKGYWSFLDRDSTDMWTTGHLLNNFKSYDTILSNNFAFTIGYCGNEYTSLRDTLVNRDVLGILCFMGERSHFYLGSYAPKTYLMNRHERIYSVTYLLLNLAAIVLALHLLFTSSTIDRKTRCVIFFFVSMSYGQALVIVPEQRFVLLPALLWMLFAATSILEKISTNRHD